MACKDEYVAGGPLIRGPAPPLCSSPLNNNKYNTNDDSKII